MSCKTIATGMGRAHPPVHNGRGAIRSPDFWPIGLGIRGLFHASANQLTRYPLLPKHPSCTHRRGAWGCHVPYFALVPFKFPSCTSTGGGALRAATKGGLRKGGGDTMPGVSGHQPHSRRTGILSLIDPPARSPDSHPTHFYFHFYFSSFFHRPCRVLPYFYCRFFFARGG